MALFGLIAGLAQTAGKYGQGVRQRNEGEGSYNPFTGESYNKRKAERMSVLGSMANPAGVLRDPYLKPGEKFLGAIGLGGLVAGKRQDRIEAERKAEAAKYQAIQEKVSDLPSYKVAPEAQEKLKLMQEAGEGLSDIGGEITDIAESRVGKEAPGAAIERENIKENSAARLQAIQESGSSQTLSEIARSGLKEQADLRNLNRKQTAYRFQAESDLLNAKINEASMEAAGAQLESSGLDTLIGEKGKVYQSNLNKQLTGLDLDISRFSGGKLSAIQSMTEAQQNQAQGMNSVANIALSYLANRSMSKAASSTS